MKSNNRNMIPNTRIGFAYPRQNITIEGQIDFEITGNNKTGQSTSNLDEQVASNKIN